MRQHMRKIAGSWSLCRVASWPDPTTGAPHSALAGWRRLLSVRSSYPGSVSPMPGTTHTPPPRVKFITLLSVMSSRLCSTPELFFRMHEANPVWPAVI